MQMELEALSNCEIDHKIANTHSLHLPGSIQRRTGCVETKRSPKVRNAHVILQQEARCTTVLDTVSRLSCVKKSLAPGRLHNVLWQSRIALDLGETTVCPVVLFSALLHRKWIRICQKGARTAQSSSQFWRGKKYGIPSVVFQLFFGSKDKWQDVTSEGDKSAQRREASAEKWSNACSKWIWGMQIQRSSFTCRPQHTFLDQTLVTYCQRIKQQVPWSPQIIVYNKYIYIYIIDVYSSIHYSDFAYIICCHICYHLLSFELDFGPDYFGHLGHDFLCEAGLWSCRWAPQRQTLRAEWHGINVSSVDAVIIAVLC